MQKSYIPLTFTLKKDPTVTTKLRICGNSSFKAGKCVSLNDCMILRWRMAHKVAHGDIHHCYQKIQSNPYDMSLRRIVIKPNGMGSEEDNWKEACFKTVSFGDELG